LPGRRGAIECSPRLDGDVVECSVHVALQQPATLGDALRYVTFYSRAVHLEQRIEKTRGVPIEISWTHESNERISNDP
jgi:hypothetical protein